MKAMNLPFGPLARLVGDVVPASVTTQELLGAAHAVAIACGVTPRTAHRWAQEGLSINVADRACDRLGVNPWTVWPTLYRQCMLTPEDEPNGLFCGRPAWYRCSGAADWYGDPRAELVRQAVAA